MSEKPFTIGCDPEFMLYNKNKGVLCSATTEIAGTKEKPIQLKTGKLFWDNVNAEIAIDPADSLDMFLTNIKESVLGLRDHLAKDIVPFVSAYYQFPKSLIIKDKNTQVFGCDPDFEAYTLRQHVIPPEIQVSFARSAGGHVHVGFDGILNVMDKINFVKLLDISLGIPSILVDADTNSVNRRSIYGKAGVHRPTEYGVEYRVLGNFWLGHPNLTNFVYDRVKQAVEWWKSGDAHTILAKFSDKAEGIINDNRTNAAVVVVNELDIPLPKYHTTFCYEFLSNWEAGAPPKMEIEYGEVPARKKLAETFQVEEQAVPVIDNTGPEWIDANTVNFVNEEFILQEEPDPMDEMIEEIEGELEEEPF